MWEGGDLTMRHWRGVKVMNSNAQCNSKPNKRHLLHNGQKLSEICLCKVTLSFSQCLLSNALLIPLTCPIVKHTKPDWSKDTAIIDSAKPTVCYSVLLESQRIILQKLLV